MNKAYLVIKILEPHGVVLPETYVYKNVELRSSSSDLISEVQVFQKSATQQQLNYDKYTINTRIATIVTGMDKSEIIVNADKNFYDVLDVKNFDYPVAKLKTSSIGLIKNLTTGETQAIEEREFSGMSMFVVKNGNLPTFDFSNYILTSETELSQRFFRASHWVRNGKNESNIQLKILFYWFALEALLKESDSDNIGGIIRWSLGFPNGKLRSELSNCLLQQLESHNKYRYWGKRIEESLDKIRTFRNNSVHHGFRINDFSNEELRLYKNIMNYSVSRCSAIVRLAILNQIDTLSELKDYLPYLFEMNSNVINDVHNNIIYSLQNPL